ncbi:MAG: hypothetical protein LUH63_11185 [Parabacteroides sp.]|nr:hypothetical protein [Parabacteroides sp.]
MEEINFENRIPTVLDKIQNNLAEVDLNNIFTECDITDFLVDRRDFVYEEDTHFLSPWDEEKAQKAATEKWESLTLKEKKEVISKWAKTCLKALKLEICYPSSN